MKKTFFLLLLFLIPSISFAQKKSSMEEMRRTGLISLSPEVVKKIPKAKLPKTIKLTANGLIPQKGYTFYGKTPYFFVFSLEEFRALDEDDVGKISVHFRYLGTIPIGDPPQGIGLIYCSCGSNVSETEGDDCDALPSEGDLKCLGECRGENAGQKCGFTQFSIFFGGGVSINNY
jgi:hypothetical protein